LQYKFPGHAVMQKKKSSVVSTKKIRNLSYRRKYIKNVSNQREREIQGE